MKNRPDAAAGVPAPPTNEELLESLGELFALFKDHLVRVLEPYDMPPACAKALRLIDGSLSMKDLGRRIHCDGSFVTSIADALEERGLAHRETDPDDRRIKTLVLTRKGAAMRARLGRTLIDSFPGLDRLDAGERTALVALARKLRDGMAAAPSDPAHTRAEAHRPSDAPRRAGASEGRRRAGVRP